MSKTSSLLTPDDLIIQKIISERTIARNKNKHSIFYKWDEKWGDKK